MFGLRGWENLAYLGPIYKARVRAWSASTVPDAVRRSRSGPADRAPHDDAQQIFEDRGTGVVYHAMTDLFYMGTISIAYWLCRAMFAGLAQPAPCRAAPDHAKAE